MTRTLTLTQVEDFASTALQNAGACPEQAAPVAHSIRDAEAESTRGIGLGYLPFYCNHLKVGKIRGDAAPAVTRPKPGLVLVDAADGFAHPAFAAGKAALIAAAQKNGIAMMGIRNAYACGVLGWFTDTLARDGLAALMTANASSTMAPWGGRKPFFGTNPWSFAAPRAGDPLVIDSSSSATAFVNLINAANAGEEIPPHWGLDTDGRPTTDPNAAIAGSIAPAGGHKGAALALMVEVMAAGLTGANWSCDASSLGDDEGGPPRLGQTIIAISPDATRGSDFEPTLERMLALMQEDGDARIPGERRHQNRKRQEVGGVTLTPAEFETLTALADLPA